VAPDFVVIGHVVRDVIPGGWRLGGTATFAAVQAQRLGLVVGVVTRAGPDISLAELLPKMSLAGRQAKATTTFENLYDAGHRRQRVLTQAEPLSADDVPAEWRSAPLVLMGPVCGEVPAELAEVFPQSLAGVSAQGWLRGLDADRRVQRQAWSGAPFWRGARVVFVSDEDLEGHEEQVDRWAEETPIVAVTRAGRGARVHSDGAWREIDAFPADEIDPTGAGDVFATAFLARLHETDGVAEATRFACAAAACSVEGPGTDRIAGRAVIEERMARHPEIALR
jgi:sugar/nucleoside kinase (ribokinase family)